MSGSVGSLASGQFNIVNPNWPTPTPKVQYEYQGSVPFSQGQTIVPVPAQTNPTQAVPPLPPVANTDLGGPP